jgi:6-phosphofructokinase 1
VPNQKGAQRSFIVAGRRVWPCKVRRNWHCIGKEIEKRFENIDTIAVVLGHLQRGGSPNSYDRVLATRFGIDAINLVLENKFGQMGAIQGNTMVSLPLKDVIGKRKTVDSTLYEIAATFFG